jgi:apolipoprotein N-acyltransferase
MYLACNELIKFFNCLKEYSSLKWFGSSFHVLAAKYLKVLIPYLVVLVNGILAVFWYLKEYLLCLIVIKSCKYKGLVLLTILNV